MGAPGAETFHVALSAAQVQSVLVLRRGPPRIVAGFGFAALASRVAHRCIALRGGHSRRPGVVISCRRRQRGDLSRPLGRSRAGRYVFGGIDIPRHRRARDEWRARLAARGRIARRETVENLLLAFCLGILGFVGCSSQESSEARATTATGTSTTAATTTSDAAVTTTGAAMTGPCGDRGALGDCLHPRTSTPVRAMTAPPPRRRTGPPGDQPAPQLALLPAGA